MPLSFERLTKAIDWCLQRAARRQARIRHDVTPEESARALLGLYFRTTGPAWQKKDTRIIASVEVFVEDIATEAMTPVRA